MASMGNDYPYPEDRFLLLGKTGRAHGLHGEIRIHCYSGDGATLSRYRELVFCDQSGRLTPPLAVATSRPQGQNAIVRIAASTSREAAEKLEGMAVLIDREQLPVADSGEYYWHEITGKTVITVDGLVIGRVDRLFCNGAQDILVVATDGEEVLIPMTRQIVVSEGPEGLVIDPPPGLLEINTGSKDPVRGQTGNDL
jgi:16S rRNA processing protein RimM